LGDDEAPVTRQTYKLAEVAVLLGISLTQAHRLALSGAIPMLRVGKKLIVVPRKPIQQMLAGKRRGRPRKR
jgi:hypothetical protein